MTMPHKYNAERRHRIPRSRYKVTNWRDYEAGRRQRGSLTVWFTEEAIAAWRAAPRATPGGQLGSRGRDNAEPEGGGPPAAGGWALWGGKKGGGGEREGPQKTPHP